MSALATRRSSRPRSLVALLAVLAGCGVSSNDVGTAGSTGAVRAVDAGRRRRRGRRNLPPRPAGEIRLDGVVPRLAARQAAEATTGRRAPASPSRSTKAKKTKPSKRFCAGTHRHRLLAARRSRRASTPNARRNGVEPVQIEIASDAAILAIANETNVGVDCLSATDVREIFRAASPVTSWSQVGYGTTPASTPPLKVAGPEPSSGLLSSFSELVLGDSEPSRLLLRGDYEAHREETEVLDAVASDHGRSRSSPPTAVNSSAPRRASTRPLEAGREGGRVGRIPGRKRDRRRTLGSRTGSRRRNARPKPKKRSTKLGKELEGRRSERRRKTRRRRSRSKATLRHARPLPLRLLRTLGGTAAADGDRGDQLRKQAGMHLPLAVDGHRRELPARPPAAADREPEDDEGTGSDPVPRLRR